MREVNYDERWKVARDLACKINLWPTVENLQQIDAALRRAKAEGVVEGMRETKWGIELVKDEPVRDALLRWVDAKIDVVEAKLKAGELDARAAQIEEGE